MKEKKVLLSEFWSQNYIDKGTTCCGICGNHGVIDNTTTDLFTPAGMKVGGKFFCICPNGQRLKEAAAKYVDIMKTESADDMTKYLETGEVTPSLRKRLG